MANQDAYQLVTDQIIAELENGNVPWRKPWTVADVPRSLATGRPYQGINTFLLMNGVSPWWATWNQVLKRGGRIKFEERKNASTVVYWKIREVEDPKTKEKRTIPFLRTFRVFNLDQTTGVELTDKEKALTERKPLSDEDGVTRAEEIIAGWKGGPRVRHDSDAAFYIPKQDMIHLPKRTTFHSASEYYATRFHEMIHSTGHESRLDRWDGTRFVFGEHAYGREELVAELGNAYLSGEAGILPATLENSGAYLRSWLATIREDARAVVVAATAAQKAADLILNRTKETEKSEED